MINPTEGLDRTGWPGVWITPDHHEYVIELSNNQGWLRVPTDLTWGDDGFDGWLKRLRLAATTSDAFDIPFDLLGTAGVKLPDGDSAAYEASGREYDAGDRIRAPRGGLRLTHDEPATGVSSTSEAVDGFEAVSGGLVVPGGGWMATLVIDRLGVKGTIPWEVEFVTVPVTAFIDDYPHVPWVNLDGRFRLTSAEEIDNRLTVILWHPDQGTSNPHHNPTGNIHSRRSAERYARRWYKINYPGAK